jgi:hypothetical protein
LFTVAALLVRHFDGLSVSGRTVQTFLGGSYGKGADLGLDR